MRDDELRPSGNIEDRRGLGGATKGGLGIGAILILALISWATGIDPRMLIGGAEMLSGGGSQQATAPAREGVPADATGTFVAKVLGETEDVWSQVLPQQTGVRTRSRSWCCFPAPRPLPA
ncbi:MAG: neutral zinc metallopeptidase, partial [Gammaproteobacteria bacterium]|nr:neutral zinc metallopeptidase [Gammaproteobacteria bacterium]